MNADVAVDDELWPRETYALVRVPLELEREPIADVHHDLGRAWWHLVGDPDDLDVEQAVVDVTGVALGAGDGHLHAVAQHLRRIGAPTTAGMPSSRAMIAA